MNMMMQQRNFLPCCPLMSGQLTAAPEGVRLYDRPRTARYRVLADARVW